MNFSPGIIGSSMLVAALAVLFLGVERAGQLARALAAPAAPVVELARRDDVDWSQVAWAGAGVMWLIVGAAALVWLAQR